MTGRAKHPRRASTRSSYAVARAFEDEGGEEERETDEEVVPRKRDKGKGRAVEVFDSDEGEEDEDETSEDDASDWEESCKKPKKSKSAGRKGGQGGGAGAGKKGGRKGKDVGRLEVMKTLPLELLVEIFSHLDPNDLLALSMVNKQYRSLLGSPAYQTVWQESRGRLDLPDVSSAGLTEFQYAHLMFGKRCQACNSPYAKRADFGIMQRLCKACRNVLVVRLDWNEASRPGIHPQAKDCVLLCLHSQNDMRYLADAPYGLIADLEWWSNKLWELEYADADAYATTKEAAPSGPANSASSRSRSSRAAQPSYVEDDVSDDSRELGPRGFAKWERVLAIVNARLRLRAEFREDAIKLRNAERELHKLLAERKRVYLFPELWMERAQQIEDRVRAIDRRFGHKDFDHDDFLYHKLVFQETPLTDEEWETIKSKVLKILYNVREKRYVTDYKEMCQDRQHALRRRYDGLKSDLEADAQPFMPLFVDFLLFESVMPLWVFDEVRVDDELWEDALVDINEEIEQYRLELILHAHEIILSATTDPDDRQTQDTLDEPLEATLDDAFFSRATSFVCCAFQNCKKPLPWDEMRDMNPRPDAKNCIGPLVDVLKHQHLAHNFQNFVPNDKVLRAGPQFHINLPLEIACAVSALLELGNLDEATAGLYELRAYFDSVHSIEWENATCFKRKFRWRGKWFDLLCTIKKEVDKASRLKPPLALEPPVLVVREYKKTRSKKKKMSDRLFTSSSAFAYDNRARSEESDSDGSEDEGEDEDGEDSG